MDILHEIARNNVILNVQINKNFTSLNFWSNKKSVGAKKIGSSFQKGQKRKFGWVNSEIGSLNNRFPCSNIA